MRVDVWSDVNCPWCYITKRTFETALERSGAQDVEVVLHPFQIDGEQPEHATPMLEWLADKYGADRARFMNEKVTEAGRRHGITFRNAAGFNANTLHAHRLLRHARRVHDRRTQSRLEERILAAMFTECEDISDVAVLADRAARSGMDRLAAEAFLRSADGYEDVRAEVRAARAAGITTVPRFAFDHGQVVEGAQEDPDVFLTALARPADVRPVPEETPR
ncbi:DsbA family protein [Streptomyces sp. NPDC056486]|uniref:DsbA family oxidoreductase n=1 Tax=Streptomyces sp. NPDC056486 TaxID=3345835 RepID=UPI0036B1433B